MNKQGVITESEKKYYEKRNLRFYKLLGQNYEVLVNGILRGKDIYYEIPKKYQLNTKKPFVLDWLMDYGKPDEISQVRSFGPVRLLCIYNALVSWIEQNPEEEEKWIYKEEWNNFFKDNPKAFKKPEKTNIKKKEEPKPIQVVMPEFEFYTKGGNFRVTTGEGDVFISIVSKVAKDRKKKSNIITFHFRRNSSKKFNSEHIVFAVYKNRIYFKEATLADGFKFVGKNKITTVIKATIGDTDVKKFNPFCNKELELKYDEIYKMHFVEIDDSEVK